MADEAVEPTENQESRQHEPRDQEGAPPALTSGWLRSAGPGTVSVSKQGLRPAKPSLQIRKPVS